MMRRLLMVLMLIVPLAAGMVTFPGPVVAQSDGDAVCADALNGDAPRGYEIVYGNGGSRSQVVLGTDGDDWLDGGTGNDILCGFGGEDVLIGGSGNDILVGGVGSDELYGESGGDTIYGDTSDAMLDGGTGNNRVFRADVAPELTPCEQAAVDAGFDHESFSNIVPGTEGPDTFTATSGTDLFCGFGASDSVGRVDAGDLFIGGADTDIVSSLEGGTFFGGEGQDFVVDQTSGLYDGGPGSDTALSVNGGTFDGGAGNEVVNFLQAGTFSGGLDNDLVDVMNGGTFNGGEGTDSVNNYIAGELFNTEFPPSGP